MRIRKTEFLFHHRELFIASVRYDIAALERKSHRLGMKPCVRVNGTSDLAGIALQMAGEFPEVQFYDYTKLPQAWRRVRPNYHLTFSYDGPESNHEESMRSLSHGVNLAVVFDTKRGHDLPLIKLGCSLLALRLCVSAITRCSIQPDGMR